MMSRPAATKRLSKTAFDLSYPRRPFTCFQCSHISAPNRSLIPRDTQTSTSTQQRRHASSNESLTDRIGGRVRRKLWGTDNPTEQEDSYAKEKSDAPKEAKTATSQELEQPQQAKEAQQLESLDVSPKNLLMKNPLRPKAT